MIMEAVAIKVHKEDEQAQKDAERRQEMRKVREDLKQYT